MATMKTSKPKMLIAVIAMLLCAWFWYKRLEYEGAFISRPVPLKAAVQVPAPVAQPPAIGGIAPVIATINWANPENPAAVPLSLRGNRFLIETKQGIQFWDSSTLKTEPLQQPLADAHLLDKIWKRTNWGASGNGILFAISSGTPTTASRLYWLRDEKTDVEMSLDFPKNFTPTELVDLPSGMALICSSQANYALIVNIIFGKLMQVTEENSPGLKKTIQNIGVIGPVDGVGDLEEQTSKHDGDRKRPLLFDTRSCSWSARFLPEPLASGKNIKLLPKDPWENPSIFAASWLDPFTNEKHTLDTPLNWRGEWRERQKSDFFGFPPDSLPGIAADSWIYSAAPAQGKFAFLEWTDDRWRESTQEVPTAEGMKLLPIGNEGVLALLIDAKQPGRIVRLDPVRVTKFDNQFKESFAAHKDNVISLNGDGLMIVKGGNSGGHSDVSMINPGDTQFISLPDLPQPQKGVSGVQMYDGSVLVFGGIHPVCYERYLVNCLQGVQPSYRWIPSEKRWQTLPTLSVSFAYGKIFDGGYSGISAGYPRGDFILHGGKELYYLSRGEAKWLVENKIMPSRLYRWTLDGATETLASTLLSRYNSTLIEIDDGRIAVIGGESADEPESPACQACKSRRQQEVARLKAEITRKQRGISDDEGEYYPEQAVPQCDSCTLLSAGEHFAPARSCELYDHRVKRWYFGSFSNYPGGRAVKMSNGRIFKLGLLGFFTSHSNYAAETADPALTKWEATPPFPFTSPATIELMQVIGNQVLIVMSNPEDRYVIWDDTSRSWQIHTLPKHSDWGLHNKPEQISPGGAGHLWMIYPYNFEYLAWPPQ